MSNKTYESFQKQYFLSTEEPKRKIPEDWVVENISKWKLYFDPKIGCQKLSKGDINLIFLGFAFHIKEPETTQSEISRELIKRSNDPLDYLDDLCGRFLILLEQNNKIQVYHDASSSFKVFYRMRESGIDLLGYDPKILNHYYNLDKDESKEANKFYGLKKFKCLIKLNGLL